jgi:hypothetical protein
MDCSTSLTFTQRKEEEKKKKKRKEKKKKKERKHVRSLFTAYFHTNSIKVPSFLL